MDDRRTRLALMNLAVVMITAMAIFLIARPGVEPAPLPHDTHALAQRLIHHPTDWEAASAIAERALDDPLAHRFETWRAAHALAGGLAPNSETPNDAFIRAGFFHWYELSEADRGAFLSTLAAMMHEPDIFFRLYREVFDVTGDMAMLRRAQPHTLESIAALRDLAAMTGRFDDYRELRAEWFAKRTSDFIERADSLAPSAIIQSLPEEPQFDDEPMLRTALRELHERPLEVDPGRPDILDGLIDYATKHNLEPLDGLRHAVNESTWASERERATLGRTLNEPLDFLEIPHPHQPKGEWKVINGVTWEGICGSDVCSVARAEAAGPAPITIEPVTSDDVPAYVEISIDEKLVAEGTVKSRTTFATIPEGHHRVRVTLVNRRTRNLASRRVRIV